MMKYSNIQFGSAYEGFKRIIALVGTVVILISGGNAKPAKADGCGGCSRIEDNYDFTVNEEYVNVFKLLINNYLNGIMVGQEVLNKAYMALYAYLNECNYRARIKILNGEEITFDDYFDFSSYCENETDRKLIHEMIMAENSFRNKAFGGGQFLCTEKYLKDFDDIMAFIQTKKYSLTLGGIWLFKNGGYSLLSENITLHVEYKLLRESDFARFWWAYFDKDEYNRTNLFVLREGITLKEINNAECLDEYKALANAYLELDNRLKEINNEIPELKPGECEEHTIYGGNSMLLVGNNDDSDTYRTLVTTDAMGNVVEIKGRRRA